MKRLLLFALLCLSVSACTRAASAPPVSAAALNIPSPVPASMPVCQATDLESSANSINVNGDAILGVTLTNISKMPCTLANPPRPELLDARQQPLKAHSTVMQDIPAPALIVLAPDDSQIMTLVWSNLCDPLPEGDLIVQLGLPDEQSLDIRIQLPDGVGCAAPDKPSELTVTPYSDPP